MPFPIWNQSVVPCPVLTVASWPAYRFLRRQVNLLKNISQFVVIHTVKGFGIVNKAGADVFLELSWFFYGPTVLAIWPLVPLPFLNPAWTSGSSQFMYCWSLTWRILSIICRTTQDGWVMVESSDKVWSTGEGNGNDFSILAWEPYEQYGKEKKKKIWHWKMIPRLVGA